jgi:magnesium chelatase accessory protein
MPVMADRPASDRPQWDREGLDWPNRDASSFVDAGGIRWHVQRIGDAGLPRLLLLHGTGAATHSFRDLAPLLASDFSVLAPDLPGHGFTAQPTRAGLTLPGMAALLHVLLKKLDFAPDIVVGHSAGAAILIRMTLDGTIRPQSIVSLNGALRPIRGAAFFSPMAKLLFRNPVAPRLFAWRAADPAATQRLLEGTGSHVDRRGVELYARLFRRPGHIAGTLGMMAGWDLAELDAAMASLAVPLVLVTGAADRAVPPADADAVARRVPHATRIRIGHGGHLLHEEEPALAAGIIRDVFARGAAARSEEPAR